MRVSSMQLKGAGGEGARIDEALGRAPEQYSVFGKSLKMEHRYLDN